MVKLKQFWIYLRSSLWFIPALMLLGLIALALGLIEIDQQQHRELAHRWPRLFAAEPESSRAMLSAIATSMITVAGVVFSITIVALAQASSQYSPRVLRNFTRDRGNQVVLGSFVGVFAYCLVVLRSITREGDEKSVPALAVFCGFLLALLGIGFLIFFIHHIATSIQASTMIHAITEETLEVIGKMFPRDSGGKAESEREPEGNASEHSLAARAWRQVPAGSYGYVQQVKKDALLRIACEQRCTLRMEVGVGEFAVRDRPLVSICGASLGDESFIRRINACYSIDAHRTVDQDPGFGIRQLVDIAVKSLSPGINDTTTAVTAVDYLSQILCELAPRRLEPDHYFSGSDLKVISRGLTFEKLLAESFEQIIENAQGNQAVIIRLLASLRRVSEVTRHPRRRQALAQQAEAVAELARNIQSTPARLRVEARVEQTRQFLRQSVPAECSAEQCADQDGLARYRG